MRIRLTKHFYKHLKESAVNNMKHYAAKGGVEYTGFSRIMNGFREPRISMLERIANGFGFNIFLEPKETTKAFEELMVLRSELMVLTGEKPRNRKAIHAKKVEILKKINNL